MKTPDDVFHSILKAWLVGSKVPLTLNKAIDWTTKTLKLLNLTVYLPSDYGKLAVSLCVGLILQGQAENPDQAVCMAIEEARNRWEAFENLMKPIREEWEAMEKERLQSH
jgi:hypothetical protein